MAQEYVINSLITLGAAVRAIRIAQGYTQTDFAEKLGISHRWISELENGKAKRLDNDFIIRLMGMGVGLKVVANERSTKA